MKKIYVISLLILVSCALSYGQMSGTYYIGDPGTKPGGGDPEFVTLSGAVTALNTNNINGACIFYFTESKTYTDTAASLGCTGTSASNTITFKPYTGITATISFTSLFSKSIDGWWVIGSPNNLNTNLISTNYIIIDGSNSIGGSTKDLTIEGAATALQRSVFRIFGDNDFITIKNCIINSYSTSGSSTAPIQFTNFNASSVNYTPDNFTLNNNTLSSISGNGGLGVFLSNSGTPTIGMTGGVISNNIISHRGTRAVMCNYVNDASIFSNTISADIQSAGVAAGSIWLSTGTSNAGTFNIYGNRFVKLKTLNNTAGTGFGIIAIDNQLASPKVVNIYNNFIAGFESVAGTSNAIFYGIRHAGSSTSNVYHNSIYIPEMTDMTTFGTSRIAGIAFATHATTEASPTGTMNLANNIVLGDETAMKTWGIRRVGTGGTFTSNYNNVYSNPSNTLGFFGFDNATDQQTLANWIANTTYDDNSKSVAVTFSSITDLHLAGGSIGDINLLGTGGTGITTDIDGDTRLTPPAGPYMGADEASAPLPVELNSFNAKVSGSFVSLSWETQTEVNSYKFEIERMVNNTWTKIGEVPASGNSNSPKSYNFTDSKLMSGSYQYRLKMIDVDGKYEYSNIAEVNISVPTEFTLSQNYPNPFNPTTQINYSIPFDTEVQLNVYSVNGELVRSLVSGTQTAGNHTVEFDASDLASGTYIYRLSAKDFAQTKKMILVK